MFILFKFVLEFSSFVFSSSSSSSSISSCLKDKRLILLSLLMFKDDTAKLIMSDSIQLWKVIPYNLESGLLYFLIYLLFFYLILVYK